MGLIVELGLSWHQYIKYGWVRSVSGISKESESQQKEGTRGGNKATREGPEPVNLSNQGTCACVGGVAACGRSAMCERKAHPPARLFLLQTL